MSPTHRALREYVTCPPICWSKMAPTVISFLQQVCGVLFSPPHLIPVERDKGWTSTLFIFFLWIFVCLLEMVFVLFFCSCLENGNLHVINLKYTTLLPEWSFFDLRFHWQSIPKGSSDKAEDSCYETSKMYWKACLLWCLVLQVFTITQKMIYLVYAFGFWISDFN